MDDLFQADRITSYTLVGTFGVRPSDSGNCFSVKSTDGRNFRIVNFNLENLEVLQEKGLKFPIQCKAIGNGIGIVHDGRIGERWYCGRFCEICCPKPLLPITQIQCHERAVMRGERVEGDGWVQWNMQVKAEFA